MLFVKIFDCAGLKFGFGKVELWEFVKRITEILYQSVSKSYIFVSYRIILLLQIRIIIVYLRIITYQKAEK